MTMEKQMPQMLSNMMKSVSEGFENIVTHPRITGLVGMVPDAVKHPVESWNKLSERRKKAIKKSLFGFAGTIAAGYAGLQVWNTASEFFKPKATDVDQVQVNYNNGEGSGLSYEGGNSLSDSDAVNITMGNGEAINLPILEGEYEPGSKCDNYRVALVYLSEGNWFRAAQAANRNVVDAPAHSGDEERIIRFAMENDNDGADADPNLDILPNVEDFYNTRGGEIWGDDITQHCE